MVLRPLGRGCDSVCMMDPCPKYTSNLHDFFQEYRMTVYECAQVQSWLFEHNTDADSDVCMTSHFSCRVIPAVHPQAQTICLLANGIHVALLSAGGDCDGFHPLESRSAFPRAHSALNSKSACRDHLASAYRELCN